MADEKKGIDYIGRIGGVCGILAFVWSVANGSLTYISGHSAYLTVHDEVTGFRKVGNDFGLDVKETYHNIGNATATKIRGVMMMIKTDDVGFGVSSFFKEYCPGWHLFPSAAPIYKGDTGGTGWEIGTDPASAPVYLSNPGKSSADEIRLIAVRCLRYNTGIPWQTKDDSRVWDILGCSHKNCESIAEKTQNKAFSSYALGEDIDDLYSTNE